MSEFLVRSGSTLALIGLVTALMQCPQELSSGDYYRDFLHPRRAYETCVKRSGGQRFDSFMYVSLRGVGLLGMIVAASGATITLLGMALTSGTSW